MDYETLINGLLEYFDLYNKGLKKQANKYIEEFVGIISAWDRDKLNQVLFELAEEVCDRRQDDVLQSRIRHGVGRFPYPLHNLLRDYLYQECQEEKMPQMRWFYELFRHDKVGNNYAPEILGKAYASVQCDQRTVELFFEYHLEILDWGAHHFPEGCIIEDKTFQYCVGQCKKIMAEKDVPEWLQRDLQYYETLYACFAQYVQDGKKKDFDKYCEEAGITFSYSPAFYYTRS